MLFCLQEEFALRLVANNQQNKSYGALSVITQNHFNLKIIKKINKKMFYPVPKVNSAFVYFFNNKNQKLNLEYNKFVKILFQFRRKTLYNNLLPHINDKEQLQNIFQQYNLSSKTRINDLNIEQIEKLYKTLVDKKNNYILKKTTNPWNKLNVKNLNFETKGRKYNFKFLKKYLRILIINWT